MKFFSFLANPNSKFPRLLLLLILAAAIPLTVFVVQQQQETRQRALESEPQELRGQAGDLWADIVLGKRDFGEVAPLEVVDDKISAPGGIIVDRFSVPSNHPGRAYIWDSGNSRILGIDLQECYSKPSGTRCKANIVIGQPSTNDYGACNQDSSFQNYPNRSRSSASTLCGIYDGAHTILEDKSAANMYIDNQGNLYMPDAANNRVLKYISPFTTDTVADEVWGQDDFTGNECNKTGSRMLKRFPNPTSSSLCFTADDTGSYGSGVALDNEGNLWVADGGNNRVLKFSKDPSGNISKTADLVLGQSNFTSRTTGNGLNQMYAPVALRFDSQGKLYVADAGSNEPNNKRILVFNPPFTSGMNASSTFGTGFAQRDPYGSAWDRNPMELEIDPQERGIWTFENVGWGGVIKLWNFNGVDVITRFNVGARGIGSIGFDNLGNILYSSYTSHDIYRYALQSGGSYVFDKSLFLPPYGANLLTNKRFISSAWTGVAVAGNQLIVSDSRLLFWNLGANYDLSVLSNGKAPDGYVGASSFTQVPNPQFGQIKSDGNNKVWIAKQEEIRVYQTPLTTNASPIKTITSPLNVLGGGQITFDRDRGIWGLAPTPDGQFLWLSQPHKHRVLRVRNPLSDNPVVDVILGQTDLGQTEIGDSYCNRNPNDPANTNAWAEPNPFFVTLNTLCYPGAISLDKRNNLYVSDHYIETAGNKRLLMFSADDFPNNNTSVIFAPNAIKEFPRSGAEGFNYSYATFEPAFDSTNRMVVGFNPYTGNRFLQYFNPTNTTLVPDGRLEDFYNWPIALTFDPDDNLYAYDANRGQIRIYKKPFQPSSLPTQSSTPFPSPTITPIPPTQLSLLPPNLSASTGQEFTVQVILNNSNHRISGVDLNLQFNHAVLELKSFTSSIMFSSKLLNRIDNTNGTLRYTAVEPGSVENRASYNLGTLTLRAKTAGAGTVTFQNAQITAIDVLDQIPTANNETGTYTILGAQPTVLPTATTIPTNTPVPPTPTIQPTAIPSPTPTSAPLLGDANGDSTVDILDYNIWRDEFLSVNPLGGGGFRSDFNTDGRVDLLDFNIWRTAFGSTPTTSPTSNPSPTTVSQAKRVFVTSTLYNGNLGGLDGADAKCQERANAATLGGTWKAWLSDSTTSAGSRLTHSSVPYKLVNGTVVADNWADLTDGNIQNPINITEENNLLQGADAVWTNTYYWGNINSSSDNSTCSNWSSNASSLSGLLGTTLRTDAYWSFRASDTCSSSYPLYCFEQ